MDAVTRLLENLPHRSQPPSVVADKIDCGVESTRGSSAETEAALSFQPIIKDAHGQTHYIAVNSVLQMILEAENEIRSTAPAVLATPQGELDSTPLQSEKCDLLARDVAFEEVEGLEYTNTPHRIDIEMKEAVRLCKSKSFMYLSRSH